MVPQAGMIAIFGGFGGQEMIVILVVGLLLFGRRLPEIARSAGQTVVKLRRGFEEFKRQLDEDDSLREAKDSARELKSALDVPRIATDPKRLIKKLGDDAMRTPPPDERPRKDPSAPDEGGDVPADGKAT